MNKMDILDISSDSDVDSELQDLEYINAVLKADEQTSSTVLSVSQMTPAASTSACVIQSTSTATKELNKIEEALALNKLMDEKYQKIEKLLMTRLQECLVKLKEIGSVRVSQEREVSGFRYFQCGRPYFKDKFNFAAPPNEDTILMQRSQMFDFSTITTISGWTVNDKTLFTNVMLTMSQEVKVKQLLANISQLKRESNKSGKSNESDIKFINKQIIDVKTKTLEELALPVDMEYDWETIANKLNYRHVTQEYRAFWKLFFHPSINKNPWSKKEHRKLEEIATENNYEDWDKIAKTLNTQRTGYQCFVYFRTNMSTTNNGKKWTKEEIEYLKRLIDYYKEDDYIPWTRVASSMENRTKIQIYNKYIRLREDRKGRFLPEEDAVILNCGKKFGNDFKKISEFLPGRSPVQIRMRYNILINKNISVMWTVEEDRKLLQLMSNEDSVSFYANATKHLPGKSRAHIRSRYLTLVNWMRKNPHWDVKYAPRRGARRLPHGAPPDDSLSKAIENLEQRIKSEMNSKKCRKLTKDSSEKEIEDSIIAIFLTELNQDDENSTVEQEGNEELTYEPASGSSSILNEGDVSLKNILLLLNAQLNPHLFKESLYINQHPTLSSEKVYDSEKLNYVIKVKSYSKKDPAQKKLTKQPDIWGNNLLGTLSYVLPPHYATITGCKALMSVISTSNETEGSISLWTRRNEKFKNQMTLLMERFNALFTWPMMLSNVEPNSKDIGGIATISPVERNPKNDNNKRCAPLNSSSVTIPPVKRKFLKYQDMAKYKDKTIDLPQTNEKDNVTLKENFTLIQSDIRPFENETI